MPPTPSGASASSASRALLVALSFSRASLAQEVEPESPSTNRAPELEPPAPEAAVEPSPEAEQAAESVPAPRIQITTVGSALSPTAVERMLGSALESSFRLRLSEAHDFEPEDLFRSRAHSEAQVHVWIDTRALDTARIYFATSDGARYLVRDFSRSNPLDEMDREAIAQAIEWSLEALVEGTAGMTREEAEALFSESDEEGSELVDEQPSVLPPPSFRRLSHGWLPEVALQHRWAPHSSEFPWIQGPSLRVGLDHISASGQLGLAASVHYEYPQRHAAEGIALELQTVGLRLGGRLLSTSLIRGSGIGLQLSGGFDAVRSTPEALDRERFEASESAPAYIPVFASGLVWQVRAADAVRFEAALGLEIDLVAVNYDILTSEGAQTLVSRWPARPALSVGVALF